MSNSVILKTRAGLNRPTLATLDQDDLINQTMLTLADVAPGVNFTVKTVFRDKSHTRAAGAYGGGGVYRHTLRSDTPVTINNDVCYPQIIIVDQTFAGGTLKVFVGFFRLVCSNGLVVSAGETTRWSVSHRLSSVQQLMELSSSIAAAWSSVIKAQDVLTAAAQTTVIPGKVIDGLTVFSENRREQIKRALPTARAEDVVTTAYGLYNFINELDRRSARINSTAHLDRDSNMLSNILQLAAA
ncbi:Protein of unknown function DUF932 [uncultured Caudovirales phage]|uniref:DUF932 domain-containing protein n=1 Tax=uncultured Caudovirales phage TaxID=2100421 RepID=A0A6J7WWM1_9CAUD|nr:Protein of unknown function DUF932 [uncultured Caudovirales phage]